MGPLIALCFALLANVAKLSFSPDLPNSPVSPTFMGVREYISFIALHFRLLILYIEYSGFLKNQPYLFSTFA